MFTSIAYSNDFKLEKTAKKGKHMENQKAKHFKTETNGNKINGEKKERQQGKKMGNKWICPFCIFLAFILLSRFVFFVFLLFVCFCLEKSNNKSKIKAKKTNRKNKINANGQVHFYPHFSPFLIFLCFSSFSTFILLLCFWILLICFLVFPFFCFCRAFFQVKKKIE